MEDKILEMIENSNRLPDYVFSRKYHHIYFFEMPMAQFLIQRLINKLNSISASNNYSGILLEPFNPERSPSFRLMNEIPEIPKETNDEEKEITWAFNIGYIIGENWEMYYEFKSEILLVGIDNVKDIFDELIRSDSSLMKHSYPLDDLTNYFKSIATSNYDRPIDGKYEDFLNKININYIPFASSV
jgi:hypothetical protein